MGSNDYKCINRLKRMGTLINPHVTNRQMLPGVYLSTKFELDLTGILTEKGVAGSLAPR